MCVVPLEGQESAFLFRKAECLVQSVIKWLWSGLRCNVSLPQRPRTHSSSRHLKLNCSMTSKPPFALVCPAFCQGCCRRVPEGLGRCSRRQWPPTPHQAGARPHRTFKSPVLLETTLHPHSSVPLQYQMPREVPLRNDHVAN